MPTSTITVWLDEGRVQHQGNGFTVIRWGSYVWVRPKLIERLPEWIREEWSPEGIGRLMVDLLDFGERKDAPDTGTG